MEDNIIAAQILEPLLRSRPVELHKKACGRVLVVGGNLGYRGAATLCGTAALRAGAGMVYVLGHPEQHLFFNINAPELICPKFSNSDVLKASLQEADIVALGPGLGRDQFAEDVWQTFAAAIQNYTGTVIIDADGLYFLATQKLSIKNLIITPHAAEAARLLACDAQEINCAREKSARALAIQYNAVCVLKGHHTLVTDGKKTFTARVGNAGLATAGTGDVLTGMIAGFCDPSLNLSSLDAACAAVYAHGKIADNIVAKIGERALVAHDLIDYLACYSLATLV